MSLFAIKQRQQQPTTLVAAVFGLVTSIIIAVPSNDLGLLLLGIVALLALTFLEPVNAVVVCLIIAPLKALIAAEAPGVVPGDIGQISLLLLGFSWLFNRILSRKPLRLEVSWVQVPLAVFLFAIVLSLPGATSLTSALSEMLKWVEISVLVSLCLSIFRNDKAHWLVFALVLAGTVQAITGIYQFFGGSGAEHLRILDEFHYRAFGTFGQPNPFGAFMGIFLPLAVMSTLGYGIEIWNSLTRRNHLGAEVLHNASLATSIIVGLFYLAASGLMAGALLASWSRGAWMGFAGAALVMLFFIPKSLPRSISLVALLIVFGGIAWSQGLIPDAVSTRMVGFVNDLTSVTDVRGVYVTDENYAITERIAHWQAAEWMARDNPWTGVGFDNYEVVYATYALMDWQNPLGHAHNYYLNLLAELGLAGLIAYLITWLSIGLLTLRASRITTGLERMWSVGLLGTWTYIAVHSLVDKIYVNNVFIHIGCMLGLLAILLMQGGEPAS